MKKIAIMQPTFIPWAGYFSLIDRVDEFVFLDSVQFDKRSWQQRNKIKTNDGSIWLTVPVISKGLNSQVINDVNILHEGGKNPLDKLKRSIQQHYSKSEYFSFVAENILNIFDQRELSLSNLNISLILRISELIGIKTKFLRSSEMSCAGTQASLLLDICKKTSASAYVSPPGSKNYLEKTDVFKLAKIEIIYHDYEHPTYKQLNGNFIPYLSIIDLISNEGHQTLDIIRSGI
jgi:hypothetical protein